MEALAQAKTRSSSVEGRPSAHFREPVRSEIVVVRGGSGAPIFSSLSPMEREYLLRFFVRPDRVVFPATGIRRKSHISQLPELAQGRGFIFRASCLMIGALLR
jgi:hypothetical protein